MKNHRLRNLLFLFGLALCWGPSFFCIMIALKTWPPFTIVAVRLTIASVVLSLILWFQKKSLWQWRHIWYRFVIMGFVSTALPFALITYSEKWITSSMAGIINGTPPIFTAILAHFFIQGETLSWRKIIGILIGVGGITSVFLPSLLQVHTTNTLGIVFVLVASLCYAIGMVYSRKFLMHLPPLVGPTGQVISAALMLIPFALFLDKSYNYPITHYSTLLAVVSLALLGTVLAFIFYYALVKSAGPTYLSTATLLFPSVAIFFGVVFLQETITWNTLLGCGLIFLGLIIANRLITKKDLIFLFGKKGSQNQDHQEK